MSLPTFLPPFIPPSLCSSLCLYPSIPPSFVSFRFPLPPAQGTLKPHSAGLVSAVAEKACQLRHGTDPGEKPVVVVEFDTG